MIYKRDVAKFNWTPTLALNPKSGGNGLQMVCNTDWNWTSALAPNPKSVTSFKKDVKKCELEVCTDTESNICNYLEMALDLPSIPLTISHRKTTSQWLIWPQQKFATPWTRGVSIHGLLTRYVKSRLRMHRDCRERFPRHRLQRKLLVSDPEMHHGTCVTHVP